MHKVKRGDTLYSIASEYNTTVAALKRDNGKAAAISIPDRCWLSSSRP